jgi:leucyl aminopeptidase (aminopeptidase T)
MSKLGNNLCVAIENGPKKVGKVAVCYQKNPLLAQKIAKLLPYETVLIDSVNSPFSAEKLTGISHAIELYHPAEMHYDACRKQRFLLVDQGCLVISLYDWQEHYLKDDFWGSMDYRQLSHLLKVVKCDLEKVQTFHITSTLGTDITFSVKGRQWIMANGICRNDELSQMPDGEIYTCPVEASFTGTLVIDGTITRSWLPQEPQRLEFKQGKLVHCSSEFERYIRPEGPDIYQIGEFALGFNPDHNRIVRNISVDEKAAGTVHFALGDSYHLGENQCRCHVDMVIRHPIVETDPVISLPFFKEL